MEPTARILLRFEVQGQIIGKENISFKGFDMTKMIYIELKGAAVDDYGLAADTVDFREV